ncbi:hypothetical protein OZ13_01640 [Xanthomonas cannabis pv. cannabis]|nr:hypothetical protein OZ10_02385 [Xanthomonas cannabis pv. cannabis]KHL59478.1 hypothetical protein OZ13_01640 [Xanthomonas cannabis pv. cannabis]
MRLRWMPSPACLRRRWTHAARIRNACLQGDIGTVAASACVQRNRTHRSGRTAAKKNGRPRISNGNGKQQQHRHAGRQADPVCSRSRRRCRVFGRAQVWRDSQTAAGSSQADLDSADRRMQPVRADSGLRPRPLDGHPAPAVAPGRQDCACAPDYRVQRMKRAARCAQ